VAVLFLKLQRMAYVLLLPNRDSMVRQLDHSRNVKLDFPDEHLPKFK
jgi:hypothetical protein